MRVYGVSTFFEGEVWPPQEFHNAQEPPPPPSPASTEEWSEKCSKSSRSGAIPLSERDRRVCLRRHLRLADTYYAGHLHGNVFFRADGGSSDLAGKDGVPAPCDATGHV